MSAVSARGNATGADPAAFRTTYTRDVCGRDRGVRDPLGKTATTAYDAVGNVNDTTDNVNPDEEDSRTPKGAPYYGP